ncbi:MAG TPA: hypothetical protein VJ521_08110 [Acidobacteriota bacterium]|nr:hypothetical protein [Acidobacteriota bacterium]
MDNKLRWLNALADYFICLLFILLTNFLLFHQRLYQYICKVESYAGNVYGRMAVLEETEKDTGRRPIALIGDSHVEEGIGARQLSELTGLPVVNLALPGTGPLVWLHYLRSIDPDRDRFRAVIILVTVTSARSDAHDDGAQSLLPVAKTAELLSYVAQFQRPDLKREYYYGSVDRVYGFRRDLQDLILHPSRLLTVGKERKAFQQKLRDWPGETFDVCGVKRDLQTGKILQWGNLRNPAFRRLAQHHSRVGVRLNHKPEAGGLTVPLSKILEYYSESTTQIVIITSPFGLDHRVDQSATALRPYFDFLRHAAAQPGVLHWNATGEPLFHDCSNFFDYRHFNAKGRTLFTARLAKEIVGADGFRPLDLGARRAPLRSR